MSGQRYSEQFKRDAARLVTEESYSINAAAESVGVTHTTLSRWVDRYGDEADQSKRKFASKDDELAILREENRRLRMEREILKKATAFFAKDQ
ncbi:MAG: transposase [Rhodothermales bacterium]|nr:transposase [Rhodothermales bacterium]